MLSGARYGSVVVVGPADKAQAIRKAAADARVSEVRDLATDWFRFTPKGDREFEKAPLSGNEVAIEFELKPGRDLAETLDLLRRAVVQSAGAGRSGNVLQIKVDHTDSWAPSSRDTLHFGTTTSVKRLINVAPLYRLGATGQNVNVVIVDRGLHRGQIPAANYGGAWIRLPGGCWGGSSAPPPVSPEVGRHGTMIARTILSIAPDARIWELRAVAAPNELISGLGDIRAAVGVMLDDLRSMIDGGSATRAWVIVNPWGLFDRRLESHVVALDKYATSLRNTVNLLMPSIATDLIVAGYDVIFAAGNGGQFAPSRRQGPLDRGPGCSILGANGHPSLLSVGAVRSDGIWLGYSSQGASVLGKEFDDVTKPDLCAPSNFVETQDHARLSTGTSAASAVAAGVVALLRSYELDKKKKKKRKSPTRLAAILRQTASRPPGAAWSNRTGAGIIDAEAARKKL